METPTTQVSINIGQVLEREVDFNSKELEFDMKVKILTRGIAEELDEIFSKNACVGYAKVNVIEGKIALSIELDDLTKLNPSHATTLQTLPKSALEMILLKAVRKSLLKRMRTKIFSEESASRLVNRLKAVSSEWNHLLSTRWFMTRFMRGIFALDSLMEEVELSPNSCVRAMSMLNGKLYVFGHFYHESYNKTKYRIHVYRDREGVYSFSKKIRSDGIWRIEGVVSSAKSNCLYVLLNGGHIWKVDGNDDGITKWLPSEQRHSNRISICLDSEDCLVVREVFELDVYAPDAMLLAKIQLPGVLSMLHLVRVENGEFMFGGMSERDGFVMVRLNSSLEIIDWCAPTKFSFRNLDDVFCSNDYIFVRDKARRRVALLDSELNFEQYVLDATLEYAPVEEITGMYYDEERKQLFVAYKDPTDNYSSDAKEIIIFNVF